MIVLYGDWRYFTKKVTFERIATTTGNITHAVFESDGKKYSIPCNAIEIIG